MLNNAHSIPHNPKRIPPLSECPLKLFLPTSHIFVSFLPATSTDRPQAICNESHFLQAASCRPLSPSSTRNVSCNARTSTSATFGDTSQIDQYTLHLPVPRCRQVPLLSVKNEGNRMRLIRPRQIF